MSLGLVLCLICGRAGAQEPSGRLTVAVFGDSQAQGLAYGLSRDLIDNPHIRVLNRTHPGASLMHDRAEWIAPIRRSLARDKADIAIVMFGANDRIDLRDDDSDKYLRFHTPEWRTEYVKRADEIMKALADSGLKVIWCGNPIARSATYSSDMTYINQIFADEAARFGFKFVPLWHAIADSDGHYTAYGKDLDGVTRRLRADDGIHFTPAGYELVADKLVGLLPVTAINAAARSAP
ncbi:MAG TPA: DUF459 domain-containing protein [Stellaceae bacterium]|nr:DUF459 domain-containing protein [Stellaceae bacterium]